MIGERLSRDTAHYQNHDDINALSIYPAKDISSGFSKGAVGDHRGSSDDSTEDVFEVNC